jgi:hypothetical protein
MVGGKDVTFRSRSIGYHNSTYYKQYKNTFNKFAANRISTQVGSRGTAYQSERLQI